jgi:hypothetical protein
MTRHLVRDYENPNLSLDARVSSLARRFPCLNGAEGLDVWSPDGFYKWISQRGEDTPAWHAGHLILELWGEGPWTTFDAIAAVGVWDEPNRAVFASWARTWQA